MELNKEGLIIMITSISCATGFCIYCITRFLKNNTK
jgi:hypothetical protein